MQKNHSDCSRVAQHALILESSDYVQPDPTMPAQPAHLAIQSLSSPTSEQVCKKWGGQRLYRNLYGNRP